MSDRHFAHWPRNLPRHLTIPATNLYRNVEFSAIRYPDKAALVFYDGTPFPSTCPLFLVWTWPISS